MNSLNEEFQREESMNILTSDEEEGVDVVLPARKVVGKARKNFESFDSQRSNLSLEKEETTLRQSRKRG